MRIVLIYGFTLFICLYKLFWVVNQMKESRDGIKSDRRAKSSSVSSLPLILDIEDFKVRRHCQVY